METGTLSQLWPLKSGSTNQPTLTPGQQTTFQFNDVPDRSPTGPLAYYLPGVILTFSGAVVQSGSTGSIIYADRFFAALFQSLAWIQAWQGSAIQASNVTGADWTVLEYFANGQRYQGPLHNKIANAADGTYHFKISVFVPFNSNRLGDLEHDTSQLALLARTSQLQINVAAASVLTGLSAGATITGFTANASAILVPRQDLILGTPVEMILHQIVAGAGNAVTITGFGGGTGLQGVDPGGGVLALLFLTSANGQNGSFVSGSITDFTWPWRGQVQTQDVIGLLQNWKRLLPVPTQSFVSTASANGPLLGVPYPLNNTSGSLNPQQDANGLDELQDLLFWGLVMPGSRPRLTSLQTARSDETFNMTVAGGYSGSHQIAGFYARSWQAGMVKQWVAQVMAGGDSSLARYVLGPNYGKASLGQRGPSGKHYVTTDETRYLPYQLFPAG